MQTSFLAQQSLNSRSEQLSSAGQCCHHQLTVFCKAAVLLQVPRSLQAAPPHHLCLSGFLRCSLPGQPSPVPPALHQRLAQAMLTRCAATLLCSRLFCALAGGQYMLCFKIDTPAKTDGAQCSAALLQIGHGAPGASLALYLFSLLLLTPLALLSPQLGVIGIAAALCMPRRATGRQLARYPLARDAAAWAASVLVLGGVVSDGKVHW